MPYSSLMAIIESLVDDIDKTSPAETYHFSVSGKDYAIDLNEEHSEELRSLQAQYEEKMKHFIRVARPMGRSGVRKPNKPSYDAATVRIWANENGYEVSDRGRIPTEIIEAFENRNKKN